MKHQSLLRLLLPSIFLTASLMAGEYAVLHNGLRLRVERHEIDGERTRLFTGGGGSIELPSVLVNRFEQEEPPAAPAPVRQEPPTVDVIVDRFAAELDLPPALIHSVIAAESAYDSNAVSRKGAVGLMQLMPETARELRVADARDPGENVRGGTTYLKQLLERYAGTPDQIVRALAAYNAGPERVDYYNGLPPYNETREFVRRVLRRFLKLSEPTSGTTMGSEISSSH